MENASTTQQTTLAQKTAMVAGVALFFATPLFIFLRKKPGYRFLNPIRILVIFYLLLALGAASDSTGNKTMVGVIILFAWATLIVGLVKRQKRWEGIKNGERWHTYSRGVPWLSSFLPMSDTNVKRWAEPVAVLVAGLILLPIFNWFAYYLIFSAVCLFLFEAWDYEQCLNQMLDMLDSLVDSEVMSENVEYYSQEHPEQRPLLDTAGIPTGIAPDIQHHIERRRARQAAHAQDNLLVVTATQPAPQPPNGPVF